ncbi:PqqD family protein [Micromonospora sp. C31]|uniref:PqqD family protein n=1 Tax=Micromonospora sp. C31 TaxID=2824876 RepID=UPI001B363B91|nr:PqqD family protein [Micromonospora sp. C31]MBQ1074977.1 PqqD family protein [Micromonospora sp. C31]
MNAADSTVYRIAEQRAAWRQAGEDIVVLDTRKSVYFGLDSAGALLWRRLVDGATAAELAEALASTTDVARDRVTDDVARFLADLDRYGLVERS